MRAAPSHELVRPPLLLVPSSGELGAASPVIAGPWLPSDASETTPTLIGRDAELTLLSAALRDGAMAVIYGLPGLGATALARVAAQRLMTHPAWRGARLVWVRLDQAARAPLELLEVIEAEPAVVVIDDAHHQHAAVAAMLDALAGRPRRGALLVTSHRELEVASAPPSVRLRPLAPAAARALAQRLVDERALTGVDPAEVAAAAHGSPTWLRQLVGRAFPRVDDRAVLRELAAVGADARIVLRDLAAAARAGIVVPKAAIALAPRSYEALARRFLIELDDDGVRLPAPIAAVITAQVGDAALDAALEPLAETMRAVAARHPTPHHLRLAIDVSVRAGHVVEAEALLRRGYAAMAQAGLADALAPTLEALVAAGSIDAGLVVAHALVGSGRIADAADVLAQVDATGAHADPRAHGLAAAIAARLGDLGQAGRAYRRWQRDATTHRARAAATAGLAMVHALAGRGAEALALLQAEATGLGAGGAWVVVSEALARLATGHGAEALDALAAVHAHADADVRELAALLTVVAAIACGRGEGVRATLGACALDGGPLRRLAAALLAVDAGDVSQAEPRLARLFREAIDGGDHVVAWCAGLALGEARLAAGDVDGALALLARVVRDAEAHGGGALAAPARLAWGRAAITAGQLDAARRTVEALIEHPVATWRAGGQMVLAAAAAASGDLATARDRARVALEVAGANEALRGELLVAAAELECLGGNPEVALTTARVAAADAAARGRLGLWSRARCVEAAGLLARRTTGDAVLACATLDAVEPVVARLGLRGLASRIVLLRSLGERPVAAGGPLAPMVASGAEAAAGAAAFLRFVGATASRRWIGAHGDGRSADEADVAIERARRDLVIDVLAGTLSGRHVDHCLLGRPAIVTLLAVLARGRGAPITPDALYAATWGGEYHPLRHRNTLYSALGRARKVLAEMLPGRPPALIRGAAGWALAPELDVCVVSAPPA